MKQKNKKLVKQFTSLILGTALTGTAFGCIPVMSADASPVPGVDYIYVEVQRNFVKLNPINDEEAEIVGWYEMPSYGIIPETMDGYKIVGLGIDAFWCCDSIYGLKLPDTIRYIDNYAFGYCHKLDEINIPDGVHYIGNSAFYECDSLESIDLPDSVTYIGEGAFELCDKLKSFTFPKGVTEVADNVLSFNISLENIEMHDSIKKIGNFSFRDNPVIESIYIPDSVEEIGEEDFINCTNLKSVHLPDGWSEISDCMFYGCSSLESFEIKDCVTRIGRCAFYGCPSLKSLTIPDSVTFMGERSAGYIEGVPDWTYALVDGFTLYGSFGSTAEEYAKENGINFIGSSPYDYKTNDEGTLTITGYHGASKDLVIPSEINGTAVTQIANFAFSETDIKSVVIPDSVDTIGGCVFEECTSLESVTLPSGLKQFNPSGVGGQFRGCTSLESIVLPDTLEAMGLFVFADCEKLKDVNVPKSIRHMDKGVFENTAWQNSQPDGPLYFGDVFYTYKGSVPENTKLVIKDGTIALAVGALASDNTGKNLISVDLPDSLEIIEELSLCNCINLKNITIPDSVTEIGNKALGYYYDEENGGFSKYSGLAIYGKTGSEAEKYAQDNDILFYDPDEIYEYTSDDNGVTITKYKGSDKEVVIPPEINKKPVISVYALAFDGCKTVEKIIVPDTVTECKMCCFRDCTALKEIVLPKNLSFISGGCFMGCTSLEEIVLPDSIEEIGPHAFSSCRSLRDINAPASLKILGATILEDTAWYASQPDGEVYFGNVFYGYKGNVPADTVLTIKEGTISAAAGVFAAIENKENIKEIVLPESLEIISELAFNEFSSVSTITVPKGVSQIDDGNFEFGFAEDFTILGYKGTATEKYAKSNDIPFRDITYYPVTKVKLDKTEMTLDIGESRELTVTLQPSYASDKTITWISSDKSIAVVNDGIVTAKKTGSCIIYAKSADGIKARAAVTVSDISLLRNTSVINSVIVKTGDKVRIAASANGGTGGYKYAYYYKRSTNTAWKTLGTEWGTNSSVAFAPTAQAEYDIKVIVKDGRGATAEKLFNVSAVNELELTNVSIIGRESINLGSAISMIGKAVGGAGEYTYSFYFKRSTNTNWKLLGDKFTMNASARFKPTAKGTYDIRIDVKDSAGTIVKKFFTATVK